MVYILSVIFQYLGLKRTIAGVIFLGMIIACTFNGVNQIPATLASSFTNAVQEGIVAAIILFTVMTSIMTEAGIINHLVNILNSLLGRVRGGPAYISACAGGLFGMVASASSANSATASSTIVPWMLESEWPRDVAATMNTGNADLDICGPAASFLFPMLSFVPITQAISYGNLYLPLLCGAFWALAYRLLVVRHYVLKYKIPALFDKAEELSAAIKRGGTPLLMFLDIIVPLLLVIGPVNSMLKNQASFSEKAVSVIDIIVWVPVLIMSICLVLGRRLLPKTWDGWKQLLLSTSETVCSCGTVSLFTSVGSSASALAGFGDSLSTLLGGLNLPKVAMILLIGFVIALVAGPLNTTTTTVSLGLVAYPTMVAVDAPPVTAMVAFLLFVSTGDCSPPMSSPIFIPNSIAGMEDVSVMFRPLVFHYLIPLVLVGALVALRLLPIIGG